MLALGWLAGCASPGLPPDPRPLFADAAYGAPDDVIQAAAISAPSPQMQQFAGRLAAQNPRLRDLRLALLDSFRRDGPLGLRYDASFTRTAAQAFDARAGNCLSLVLMTASLARELGVPVTFQAVTNEQDFSRQDALLFASGHVNVVLGRAVSGVNHLAHDADRELTVDFLPNQDLAGQRVMPVSEATVRAMFLNNRAAELLGAGRTREAYWWARQAVLLDPAFLPALNTLGVVHLRYGQAPQAEAAFRQVLLADARNTSAMTNMVRLLEQQGRGAELRDWAGRLAALQPDPPFAKLDQGRAALAAGDTPRARDLFLAELRRQPFQHEVHYWLAVALASLGDTERAARHLALAVDHSTTAASQALYAGKLERLRQASK
jgi:Tfp pilus assembly protein PilF